MQKSIRVGLIHLLDLLKCNNIIAIIKKVWILSKPSLNKICKVRRWANSFPPSLVLSVPPFHSQSPLSGGKVDISSGSYLQYNALKANRPILPKPVQLTVIEPTTPPIAGQPVPKETLTGHCEVCNVSFESRAAARAHVFSQHHLATLRTTNFGQPTTLVYKNGNGGGGCGSVASGSQVSHSTTVSSSGVEIIIESPPPMATSSS